ncbi:MAG: nuclease-related domain-containing protein [Ardenticatenia bacterium]|nr:nuclease-related domain-containing protein [Ardenticatenia bacterium]
MKVYTNEPLVARRRKIGTVAGFVSLVMLFVAIFVSFRPNLIAHAYTLAITALIIGTVGTYHINRWVRPPVAETTLAAALKGFDRKHVLYNYYGPWPHLLLTPNGLVAIVVKRYEGRARCQNNRWHGAFSFWRLYSRGLTAERLGQPHQEADRARQAVKAWLRDHVPEHADQVSVEAVVVFLNPQKLELEMEGCQDDIITFPKKLKTVLRKRLMPRMKRLPPETYRAVRDALERTIPDQERAS